MATKGRVSKNRKSVESDPALTRPFALYVWLAFFLVTAASGIYVAIKSYNQYIDPIRIYGDWSEIGAPSWSTEEFTLSSEGVMKESRFIASTFEFDGSMVSFFTGGELYQYEVYGSDNERLKRVSGGGHVASFIKHGYEHTLPKQDNIGPARRVSLAEHFQSKR
jgi:hypothetical protein